MILLGLGSNLPGPDGDSRETVLAAFKALNEAGLEILARSRLWRTAPVPVSDQPWFVNAVASVASSLAPDALLARLHRIESQFGRQRREVNAARTLDIDLLDYHGLVSAVGEAPVLPHPRMAQRGFVLLPLAEVDPGWRHPVTGATVAALIAALPAGQGASADG